jgi:hypothetical protein
MECKEFQFAIIYQISCHYIYHLLEGKGTICYQQKSYYINESKEGVKGRLGTSYIQ